MIPNTPKEKLLQNAVDIAINTRDTTQQTAALPYDPLNAPDVEPTAQVIAANLIDNSDFSFSHRDYLSDTAGDEDYECYNWYRQRFVKLTDVQTTNGSNAITSAAGLFSSSYTYPMIFTLLSGKSSGATLSGYLKRISNTTAEFYSDVGMATPLNVSATATTTGTMWFGDLLTENAANALKATGHSLFAANEGADSEIPEWNRASGWAEIGNDTTEAFDIACPLPLNAVHPGVTFYFRCIVALRLTATLANPVRMGVGIFDNTAAQWKFLEGSNFGLNAAVVGTAGSTSYQYCVLADLDDGTTVSTGNVTVSNGPAALTTSNYIRLTWLNTTGVLRFRIYRKVGGVTKRVFTISNGGHDYNDMGTDEGETPANLPTSSQTRSIAYSVSPEFTLTNDTSTSWIELTRSFTIPPNYDMSQTTGKQWLRITIEGLTDVARAISIDRVSLSTSSGGWALSDRDKNKALSQNPTSSPNGSTQGNTGIEGCFTFDTPVTCCNKDGTMMRSTSIGSIEKGDYVFSGARRVFKVRDIYDSFQPCASVTMTNGIKFTASYSEKFVTSRADKNGTRLDGLTIGDEILCYMRDHVETAYIKNIVDVGEKKVRTLMLKGGHTFVAGHGDYLVGVLAHNFEKALAIGS